MYFYLSCKFAFNSVIYLITRYEINLLTYFQVNYFISWIARYIFLQSIFYYYFLFSCTLRSIILVLLSGLVIQWTRYNKWISRHVIPPRIESKFAGTEINSTPREQKGYYRQIVSLASNIPRSYQWIIDWRRCAPSVATSRVKCVPFFTTLRFS